MTESATPKLKDLRASSEPAWLWDTERARIVWANPAGIAYFDGQTLFDIIDRPFDPREPGIETIRQVAARIGETGSEDAGLLFPSTGHKDAVSCQCWPYKLSDGRTGLLAVERKPHPAAAHAGLGDVLQQTFRLMPMALVLTDRAGQIKFLNDSAQELLPESLHGSIQQLLAEGKLTKPFERLADSAVVVATGKIAGRYGERDAKVTLRKLEDGNGIYAFATIEDITERRLLEAQVPDDDGWVGKRLEPAEQSKAFEHIAQKLKQEIAAKPEGKARISAPAKGKLPDNASAREAGRLQSIPDTIKHAMERSGEAVIIAQKGKAVFATEKAADLFGFESGEALVLSSDIPSNLISISEPKAELRLPRHGGEIVDVDVISTHIPWLHGAARQFRIRPVQRNGGRNGSGKAPVDVLPRPALDEPVTSSLPAGLEKMPEKPDQPAPPATAREVSAAAEPRGRRKKPLDPQNVVQEELRAILDVVSDGIITLDGDGRILSFSAGAESIFGRSIGDVIGVPFIRLFEAGSRHVVRDYLAALNGPGLASIFNDGREVTAMVAPEGHTPLFLTLGRLQSQNLDAAYCAVVRDITQWKRSELELRQAKDTAENTSRQKSEFLARMGHELRTPITAILGFADLMRGEESVSWRREKFASYANDIHASGVHLLSLINDLLDLSKVEAGKMDLDFVAVSIGDAADYAMRMIAEEAARNSVVVRTAIPAKLPKVVADARALRQILLNLLSNAVKYTDAGGEVIVSAAVSPPGELHVKVKDTGIGMTREQIDIALEPFKRVRTSGRETQGTGLGLPLTRALVEANRARFEISSEKDRGTTIDIVFPTTRVLAD